MKQWMIDMKEPTKFLKQLDHITYYVMEKWVDHITYYVMGK